MKFLLFFVFIFLFSLVHSQDYVLVWNDEFNTPGLPDSTKWDYEVGKVRNTELQYYTYRRAENGRIEDTVLILEARKENYKNAQYTSASLISKMKGDWAYGRIEISARVPGGKGTWPALWMMPTYSEYGGWPRSGEIDIMEYIGVEPEHLFYTAHFEGTDGTGHESSGSGGTSGILHPWEKFIKFRLDWTPDSLVWYADGVKFHSYARSSDDPRVWPFNKMFYLILNLAYGGSWGGYAGVDDSKLPHRFLIDYVRVYQKKEGTGPFSLDIRPARGGTVSVSPEMDTYPDGTEITLSAFPDSGYDFKEWLHQGGANPFTFTIMKDQTVLPFFLRKNELLSNGDFTDNINPWSNYISNSQNGLSSLYTENGELVSDVTTSPGVNWEVGFQQSGIPVTTGRYRITFDARAEGPASLLITLAKNYGDWGSYFNWNKSLSSGLQTFTIDFHMTAGDENCRLFFGTGNFSGKVIFDNISLVRIDDIPTTVSLDVHDMELLQGQESVLQLHVSNQFGDAMTGISPESIAWSVNGSPGSVDKPGVFKATGGSPEGWVIASFAGLKDSCHVTVQQIAEIVLTPDTVVTDSLRRVKFSVSTRDPEDAPVVVPSSLYSFELSSPTTATFSADGWLKGQASGTAKLYVTLTDFMDSSLVIVECGKEHRPIDELNDPASWSLLISGSGSAGIDTSMTATGHSAFDVDYNSGCGEPFPSLSLEKKSVLYGLPDSLVIEVETGGQVVYPTFIIRTHQGDEMVIDAGEVTGTIPVLAGVPVSFNDIRVYPLTFLGVRFGLAAPADCHDGDTIYGKIRLRRLMVTYPGHAPLVAEAPEATGIAPDPSLRWKVYPNPAQGRITVNLPPEWIAGPKVMQICTPEGKMIRKMVIKTSVTEIDVSGWAPGVYIFSFRTKQGILHDRLVIAR